jgi:hypothetical protein
VDISPRSKPGVFSTREIQEEQDINKAKTKKNKTTTNKIQLVQLIHAGKRSY